MVGLLLYFQLKHYVPVQVFLKCVFKLIGYLHQPWICKPNSRKSTWLPRHRKMKPFPARAPQEKSTVRNWRSKGLICLPMQEMQEMLVWPMSQEDPVEKEMATWSNILAWKIPWTEELADYNPWGHKRVRHNLVTKQYQCNITCTLQCLKYPLVILTRKPSFLICQGYRTREKQNWG